MHNLVTPLAYWTASFSMRIPFLSLFLCWVEGLLVLGCRLLSAANRVPHSNICIQPLLPITNASLDGS